MKRIILTAVTLFFVLSITSSFSQNLPEYEVYLFKLAQFPDASFRFRDVSDPQLSALIAEKNKEASPISFALVKGKGINLIYGPGATAEGLMYGMGVDPTIDPIGYIDHKTLLGKLGIKSEDINYVVIEHTCFDTPSGAEIFPKAKVFIQKNAFDKPNPLGATLPDGTFFSFVRKEDMKMLDRIKSEGRLTIVDGDYEIAPGINIYYTPGHTYDSNILSVNTKDGKVVLAGSSCFTYLHLRYGLVPPTFVTTDAELVLQSYDKIRSIMGVSDALLVPGSDMDVIKRFPLVADRIVKVETPLKYLPEYEVYSIMLSKFIAGGGIFRFADDKDPVLFTKNNEDAPINGIYIKGAGIELVYGPGGSEEVIRAIGITEKEVPKLKDYKTMLAKLGTSPENIDYVVVGHTCFDDLGGIDQFPNAKVIIQKSAFDKPNPLGFAIPIDMEKLEKIKSEGRLIVIDGDYKLMPGIMIYHVPGHTFENQMLTVNTKDGMVTITGDASYTYLNLQRNLLPVDWCTSDAELMLKSYEKIRSIMGPSDALMVPAHDLDVYKRYTVINKDIVKIETPKPKPPYEYEVYALMVSQHTAGEFLFADQSDPVLSAKMREPAPMNCIYVKGPDFDLVFGPGPSKEDLDEWGGVPYYTGVDVLLGRIGVKPEDIEYVVVDHTCFDHPGSVDLFKNARVIVQRNLFDKPNPLGFVMEDGTFVKFAMDTDYKKLEEIKNDGRLMIIDGDYELAPGLKILWGPGHTYENSFISVNTKYGNVVATGDALYTYLHLRRNILPPDFLIADKELMVKTYEKIRKEIGDSDTLLVPGHELDVYKRFPLVADGIVKIELPVVDYSNVFFMELDKGLNMVSLPLKPWKDYTAKTLSEELEATVIIRYDGQSKKFVGYIPNSPTKDFDIEGGKGYIINVEQAKTVVFTGAAWTNTPSIGAAPKLINSAWAFVISGVLDGVQDNNSGYIIQARNIRTELTIQDLVSSDGHFSIAYADLARNSIIQSEDRLEIIVKDNTGKVVSQSIVTVNDKNISKAYIIVPLKIGNITPSETLLMQNYPNPFNPETWIPYQLSEDDYVIVKIYDLQGNLVRTFDLGKRSKGIYSSKDSAVYWDGRNDAGELVSSGLYFYQLQTSKFSSVKKMVVKK